MKAAVIVFPDSNGDRDAAVALGAAMGRAPDMVWHAESTLPATDLIVLPGGFASALVTSGVAAPSAYLTR